MRVHHSLKGSAICAFAALVGCAAHTSSITQDEKPTGKEAYLYGRFYIEAKSGKLALDGHQTMGFVIKCASGDTYTFRSSNDTALQVIKIAPSMCSLTEFVYTNSDGQIRSRKRAPEKLMRDARFDAGKAYYLATSTRKLQLRFKAEPCRASGISRRCATTTTTPVRL